MDPELQLQLSEIETGLGRKAVTAPEGAGDIDYAKKFGELELKLTECETSLKASNDRCNKLEEDHKGIMLKLTEWSEKFKVGAE